MFALFYDYQYEYFCSSSISLKLKELFPRTFKISESLAFQQRYTFSITSICKVSFENNWSKLTIDVPIINFEVGMEMWLLLISFMHGGGYRHSFYLLFLLRISGSPYKDGSPKSTFYSCNDRELQVLKLCLTLPRWDLFIWLK